MHARVQKWGNSLALRIPKSFANDIRLSAGSEVDITIHDGKMIINPELDPRYSLQQLLDGVTNGNRHPEMDTGESRGREAWY